jgi:hypothetical protein
VSSYEQDVNGYWYLVPSPGRWGAGALRSEADKLDEMNTNWDAAVKASQSDRPETNGTGDAPTSK